MATISKSLSNGLSPTVLTAILPPLRFVCWSVTLYKWFIEMLNIVKWTSGLQQMIEIVVVHSIALSSLNSSLSFWSNGFAIICFSFLIYLFLPSLLLLQIQTSSFHGENKDLMNIWSKRKHQKTKPNLQN